jgi:hypothetical protein
VEREIEDFGPGGAGFPPDEDFAVVACGGQNIAILWVRPGDAPDGAFVSGRMGVSEGGGKEEGQYPLRVSVSRWESPSTSKILTVRSEEQVARRRP